MTDDPLRAALEAKPLNLIAQHAFVLHGFARTTEEAQRISAEVDRFVSAVAVRLAASATDEGSELIGWEPDDARPAVPAALDVERWRDRPSAEREAYAAGYQAAKAETGALAASATDEPTCGSRKPHPPHAPNAVPCPGAPERRAASATDERPVSEALDELLDLLTHPDGRPSKDLVRIAIERLRLALSRLLTALRVANHKPHDQDGEPVEGFPTCSECGAIQTDAASATDDGPMSVYPCFNCGGSGTSEGMTADPLPSGEPGEPYQIEVTCPACGGSGVDPFARPAVPEALDVERLAQAIHRSNDHGDRPGCLDMDRDSADMLAREYGASTPTVPRNPSVEPHYLPMDCPQCGRRRMEWDGKVLRCEKCTASSEWDAFARPAVPALDVERRVIELPRYPSETGNYVAVNAVLDVLREYAALRSKEPTDAP